MNKIKMIAAMFIAGILLTFVSCGDNGKSKKISIAYANWSEGIAMTNLAKAIFEDRVRCKVAECRPCTYIYLYLP